MSANMIMDDAYYRFRETGGLHLESGGSVLVWILQKLIAFASQKTNHFFHFIPLFFSENRIVGK